MIEAKGITVRLGRKEVLHGIDFEARAGEVTAIVGPNGSGKTTLMRALTGEVAYGGRVEIGGQDIARAKGWELAARRAVLPQATTLAFPFTVVEVVRMGLMSGRHGDDAHLPSRALAEVGLTGYEGRFFQELSGGEQQRAQLARVLVQVWRPVEDDGPRWLLLDEPVSSLDIAHQLEVMALVARYARAGGGVVTVMHDLNLTTLHADRVAVMAEGRLRALGPPSEVMTDALLSDVYGCHLRVGAAPKPPSTFVLPHCAALV
ncbi:MAG: heme ABC transporter ATP-binding protein [Pseudomonadota bacterium]